MLDFLKIRLYLVTVIWLLNYVNGFNSTYSTKLRIKSSSLAKKKPFFHALKMLYFLKIRLYLHTETDYLTK